MIFLIKDKGQEQFVERFKEVIASNALPVKVETILLNAEELLQNISTACNALSRGGNLVVDISWSENKQTKDTFVNATVPYTKIDVSIKPFLDLLDQYLTLRNSSDVTIIFEDSSYIDQTMYYWLNTAEMRLIMSETLNSATIKKLKDIRPTPNNFALFASTQNMNKLVKTAVQEDIVKLPERWNLVFLDFEFHKFNQALVANKPINILNVAMDICCILTDQGNLCDCPTDFNLRQQFFRRVLFLILSSVEEMIAEGIEFPVFDCDEPQPREQIHKVFEDLLASNIENDNLLVYNTSRVSMKTYGYFKVVKNNSINILAKYDDGVVHMLDNNTIKPLRAFYGIGVTHAIPWSYKKPDPVTGELKWTGYCVDFAIEIAERLKFDYEFVEPLQGTFGVKQNGIWNGVVGDLVAGRTDIAVTALIMTADKEEVVDFVAPYFEQTGITIVMRKPVRKTSLFKFMTVLKLEVWFSIVAALIVTGFMVWFLDKYSPYSARNNKKAYPYPCREFTLKESFWFALTSFTPQGGGEAPKALSGRTLVAAYWLFVVLMLATFTANLAAFLTVERMQAPVQSLEQLARQSRINYTVVKNSQTHQYFINMKYAEDILYKMWKELTLNASIDDGRYRVWDYPIKEQYGHILLAINDSIPVESAQEGFDNVNEHLDADYAFIHDSSEIKYAISKNCNLTEVGEVFAEKPYAVAVQQGSHLQDDISKVILLLQKQRYFEGLQEKYWNHSAKGDCPSTDDNEGITLESLGGVFIATLFGLALAMITLAGEVFYYRRKYKEMERQKYFTPQQSNKIVPTISPFYPSEIKPMKVAINPAHFSSKIKADEAWNTSNLILFPKGRNRVTKLN
ncbi:ionotropic receptor 25a [Diabrotica virgifera virgifera]|uniref:Ionotropic receptor 25a n=1 Tax=Diabrotica virgifera virgifera TaxID=50390 RepID=A0ABM5KSB0_DIAVI|nr:ionotropic receptor 25a [Diabrotica virgifera virgifera]